MSQTVSKLPVAKAPAPAAAKAEVVALPRPRASFAAMAGRRAREMAANTLPFLVTLAALLGLWEIICSQPGAGLTPPTHILWVTWALIAQPL